MRLAFVTTMAGAPWGGSEELWAAAARRAVEAGHQVTAFVYDHGEPPARVRALRELGAAVVARRRPIHGRIDERLAPLRPRFRRLGAFAPDAVCVSQGESYDLALYGDAAELRAWLARSGTPYVLVSQLNYEHVAVPWAGRERARGVLAGAHAAAFVSRRSLEQARRHLASPIANGVVVRNPVNLASTDPVPWPAPGPGGEVRLAQVARLETPHKGQDALLEALSDRAWRDRPWTLGFYGAGPDEPYIRALIAYYGLGDRASLRGHAPDVRAIWAAHHLLALPSRNEGTPLALVEAMLCGRPAVVTDVAGNCEWVGESGPSPTGFVAPSPLPSHLHAALERAWASRDRWESMGREARAVALRQADPDPGRTLLGLVEAAARARAGAPAR